jgi:hypothetical protein
MNSLTLRTLTCCLLLVAGCGLDGGIKPLESEIRGTITFVGNWPDSLVEVRVVTYDQYPPASFTDLTMWSNPLPTGLASFGYRMQVPPGEYALVALTGRYAGGGWIPLADYRTTGGAFPDTVIVAGRESVVTGVDFTVSFVSSASGITGRIIFANPWPDTVSSIRVAALTNVMTNPPYPALSLQDINNLGPVVTKNDTSLAYAIPLAPGTYRTIACAWMAYDNQGKPEDWELNVLRLLSRPLLGVYSQTAPGSLSADSIVVKQNEWINGADITIDFDRTGL